MRGSLSFSLMKRLLWVRNSPLLFFVYAQHQPKRSEVGICVRVYYEEKATTQHGNGFFFASYGNVTSCFFGIRLHLPKPTESVFFENHKSANQTLNADMTAPLTLKSHPKVALSALSDSIGERERDKEFWEELEAIMDQVSQGNFVLSLDRSIAYYERTKKLGSGLYAPEKEF